MENSEQLEHLRHSCAHLLAAAVMELYPDAKRTIGPAIENGFYYDFDFKEPISEKDLMKIEQKMRELVKKWPGFERIEVSKEEALKRVGDNEYKKELINEFAEEGKTLTFYKSGEFMDLCRGGHVENPKEQLKHFKLLSIAGAYWHGDEKNKMLTRIYGTAFESKEELEQHLVQLEEAKKRDHRKLGKDLGLFVLSDLVGKGLPLLTPKGATVRRVLERFIVDEELKRGYQHVITPPIAKVDLYRTSGHYPYYKDTMYPEMKVDEDELILRPMTCPHHFMLYKSQPHSYKELPVRFAEISPQFRYEKSGELSGLMRVRMFMLADAHIIARQEQAEEEIKRVLELIDYVNKCLGLIKGKDYRYRLSLGDRKDDKKYYKDDAAWEKAEGVLRKVLKELNAPFYEAEKEAAFYGPKIDVQMKNVLGKEETAFTVQYDFVMPKRFDLKYVQEDGGEGQPIVVHRSSIGAFERIMAFLIEHYAGAFPVWLAPVQVAIMPVADRHIEVAKKIQEMLLEQRIRAEINADSKTLGAKIRESTLQKIPYMVIIGDKEVENAQNNELVVAVRTREGKDLGSLKIADFISQLKSTIEKYE